MRRRNYIGLLAAGSLSSIAGCNSQGNYTTETIETATSTPEPENTPTPEPENTPTPEPASFLTTDISPDSADLEENFWIEIEIENTGGQGGLWEAEYDVATTRGPEPEEYSTQTTISQYVPPGETRVWKSDIVSYEDPLVIYYRIGDGTVQTIDVPGSRSPIIEETNLVSEWSTFGDAIENSISEVEAGATVNIAARYWYWLENQTLDIFSQVEIYNESGERVDISTNYGQQVTDYSGWGEWERYTSFSSTGWDTGTYTAELLIRDEQNKQVSNAGTVEFELVG